MNKVDEFGNQLPTYNEAMDLAYNGKYEEAIEALLLSYDGNKSSVINNIGVCYEKMGRYQLALEFYHKSNCTLAKTNLLQLYDQDKVAMDEKDYEEACQYLIDKKHHKGYVFLAYLYENKSEYRKAINTLNDGVKACGEKPELIFELAWLKSNHAENDDENEEAYVLYETLIEKEPNGDKYILTAMHNYACLNLIGSGCKKDVNKAIHWFTKAYYAGYENSAYKLADIYSFEEGYRNKDAARYWGKVASHMDEH